MTKINRAVFLDRDGVLVEPVFSVVTKAYEPPRFIEDVKLLPYVVRTLKKLSNSGYFLILVSNQPDAAKGKTTFRELKHVHMRFDVLMKSNGITFKKYYYCFHHPKGTVVGYSYDCYCRKPKPYFILKASQSYKIDLAGSWTIGDRNTDVQCGIAAGTKTIIIGKEKGKADYKAKDLREAVNIILKKNR